MNFLHDYCTLSVLTEETIKDCKPFNCGNENLNDFFKNNSCDYSKQLLGKSYCFTLDEDPSTIVCAFTVSNDSIKSKFLPNNRRKKIIKDIPREKHFKSYPSVLIGRLGVNKDFKRKGIGNELMDFIKAWFVSPANKTGCRFVVVDSYNQPAPLAYYENNDFNYLFSSEQQEKNYTGISEKGDLNPIKVFRFNCAFFSLPLIVNQSRTTRIFHTKLYRAIKIQLNFT